MGPVPEHKVRQKPEVCRMKASEWTAGQWPKIIDNLVGTEYTDGKHHPCPNGNGKDCFRFSNINGRGNFFCKCSEGDKDGFDLIQCAHSTNFPGAVELVETVIGERPKDHQQRPVNRQSYAESLRAEATKTPRSIYLENRGLILPPGLDWHPSVDYRVDGEVVARYPAMLAPVLRDVQFLTYHVTYLQDGHKAPVDPCRKLLPGPGLKGAAVPLWPAAEVMGIAEGIETAIAASMLFEVPVWAALNTSLLKSWRPPEIAKRVLIFGDNDKNFAGQAAAYALGHRLHGAVDVEVHFPEQRGDYNDVLMARREAA